MLNICSQAHLLRLVVRPDNSFEVSIDHTLVSEINCDEMEINEMFLNWFLKVNHGTLLDSFTPPVNPPAEIEDPEDSMPADWVQILSFKP